MGVGVNFALVHQALFVVVEELDRIFDRDHVLFTLGVDLVEHGRQSGGFAGAGRSGNENQAARLVAHVLDDGGQTQCIEALNLPRNGTEHGAHCSPLIENIAAKSSQVLKPKEKSSSRFSSKRCFCASVSTL